MDFIFRIYDFNIYNNIDIYNYNENEKIDQNVFHIQIFGIDEEGKKYSLTINDFKPFFYLKVPDNFNEENRKSLINEIIQKIGGYYYASSITKSNLINKKKIIWI